MLARIARVRLPHIPAQARHVRPGHSRRGEPACGRAGDAVPAQGAQGRRGRRREAAAPVRPVPRAGRRRGRGRRGRGRGRRLAPAPRKEPARARGGPVRPYDAVLALPLEVPGPDQLFKPRVLRRQPQHRAERGRRPRAPAHTMGKVQRRVGEEAQPGRGRGGPRRGRRRVGAIAEGRLAVPVRRRHYVQRGAAGAHNGPPRQAARRGCGLCRAARGGPRVGRPRRCAVRKEHRERAGRRARRDRLFHRVRKGCGRQVCQQVRGPEHARRREPPQRGRHEGPAGDGRRLVDRPERRAPDTKERRAAAAEAVSRVREGDRLVGRRRAGGSHTLDQPVDAGARRGGLAGRPRVRLGVRGAGAHGPREEGPPRRHAGRVLGVQDRPGRRAPRRREPVRARHRVRRGHVPLGKERARARHHAAAVPRGQGVVDRAGVEQEVVARQGGRGGPARAQDRRARRGRQAPAGRCRRR